jgi:hypothetical protein
VIDQHVFSTMTFAIRDATPAGVAYCFDCHQEIGIGEKFLMAPRFEGPSARVNDTLVHVCGECTRERAKVRVEKSRERLRLNEDALRLIEQDLD